MTPFAADGPNALQIRYWNEESGPKWVALQAFLDEELAPFGRAALERAGIAAGERALDVGCGCGATTLELAERVGPAGAALGIDVSAPMLARARERARRAGLPQLRFEQADAQTHRFAPGSFDLFFSRFGVMFFAEPRLAFANLRRALARDGRLAFVCWQELGRNPWMLVPMAAAARHVALPPPPAEGAPGPFAFADPVRVLAILAGAGFAGASLEPLEGELLLRGGGSLEEAAEFLLQIGPAAAALREAGRAGDPAVREAIRAALLPFATPRGVRLGYAAWIATAQRGPV